MECWEWGGPTLGRGGSSIRWNTDVNEYGTLSLIWPTSQSVLISESFQGWILEVASFQGGRIRFENATGTLTLSPLRLLVPVFGYEVGSVDHNTHSSFIAKQHHLTAMTSLLHHHHYTGQWRVGVAYL